RQEADHPATQPTQQQEVTSPMSVHEPARHPSVAASAASPQAVKPHGDSARSGYSEGSPSRPEWGSEATTPRTSPGSYSPIGPAQPLVDPNLIARLCGLLTHPETPPGEGERVRRGPIPREEAEQTADVATWPLAETTQEQHLKPASETWQETMKPTPQRVDAETAGPSQTRPLFNRDVVEPSRMGRRDVPPVSNWSAVEQPRVARQEVRTPDERQESKTPQSQAAWPDSPQEVTSPSSVHEPARHPSVAAGAASPQAVKPHGDSARSGYSEGSPSRPGWRTEATTPRTSPGSYSPIGPAQPLVDPNLIARLCGLLTDPKTPPSDALDQAADLATWPLAETTQENLRPASETWQETMKPTPQRVDAETAGPSQTRPLFNRDVVEPSRMGRRDVPPVSNWSAVEQPRVARQEVRTPESSEQKTPKDRAAWADSPQEVTSPSFVQDENPLVNPDLIAQLCNLLNAPDTPPSEAGRARHFPPRPDRGAPAQKPPMPSQGETGQSARSAPGPQLAAGSLGSQPHTARTSVRSRGSADERDSDINEALDQEVSSIMDLLCFKLT
ncbi:unnamed protein product, partial [Effrenium voratum]